MEDNPNLEMFENTLTEENYTQAQAELSKLQKNFDKNFYFLEANGRFCVATGKINEAFQNYRAALNLDEGFQTVKKDHDISQRFFNDLNNSIQKIRREKTSTYRNNCSIISNLLGNAREKETLCESTKNVLSFLDRLNISVEADKKLIDEKLSVMENLFSMKAQECVSAQFPDEIYENMQTIVEPIDTIVRDEFKQAIEITN